MAELSSLPNVGKVLEESLKQVDIMTAEQLRAVGSVEAFMRIRADVDPGACLHMLYGLEGAVQGVRDTFLPAEVKQDLKHFFNSLR